MNESLNQLIRSLTHTFTLLVLLPVAGLVGFVAGSGVLLIFLLALCCVGSGGAGPGDSLAGVFEGIVILSLFGGAMIGLGCSVLAAMIYTYQENPDLPPDSSLDLAPTIPPQPSTTIQRGPDRPNG